MPFFFIDLFERGRFCLAWRDHVAAVSKCHGTGGEEGGTSLSDGMIEVM
jgi:hypothetical protein